MESEMTTVKRYVQGKLEVRANRETRAGRFGLVGPGGTIGYVNGVRSDMGTWLVYWPALHPKEELIVTGRRGAVA
jgi:hypothetical protein